MILAGMYIKLVDDDEPSETKLLSYCQHWLFALWPLKLPATAIRSHSSVAAHGTPCCLPNPP